MKKEQFIPAIVISLMLIYIVIHGGVYAMESNWVKSYRNAEKASNIVKYLIENYTFTNSSISNPGNPPLGTDFGRYPTIVIYMIVDTTEQDKIIGITKQYMEKNDIDAITVKFYESENWIVKKDASGNTTGGMRGPEKLIREVTLKNTK